MNFAQQTAMAQQASNESPRPYVRFVMRADEDRSLPPTETGYAFRDDAWALVQAAGSRDMLEKPAVEWLAQLKAYARDGRIPQSWPSDYQNAFDLWRKGEEMPVEGTSVKTWPPCSPGQRATLLALGVFTVEALSTANTEVLGRLGMGASTLQNLAKNWLKDAKGPGALARALEATEVKLAAAQAQIDDLREQLTNQTKA